MNLDELISSSRAGYDAPTAADKARVRSKLAARLGDEGLTRPPISDVFRLHEARAAKPVLPEPRALSPKRRRAGTPTKFAILAAALFVGTASALAAHSAYVARTRTIPLVASAPPPARPQPRIPASPPLPAPPFEPPSAAPAAAAGARPTHPGATYAIAPTAALSAEMQLVQDARDALQRGDPSEALATLDRFNARFKSPTLAPEAAGLRVLALCASGRTDEARARATSFLRKWPRSPLAARIEQQCTDTRGPKP